MKNLIIKFAFIIFPLILINLVSFSQTNAKEEVLNQLYEKEGEQYFSFQSANRATIQELSRIISIDNVEETGIVYAYANKKGFSRFLDFRLPYEILLHPGDFNGFLNMKSHIDIRNVEEWDFYPTYEAYVDMMYQFAADYPSLCQIVSIGTSVQGRELLMAKISDNIGIRENEPQFLYTSTMHGDETTGYILMLRLIDYLLSNYGSTPKVTNLVDNIEIWINPLANPDGTYAGGNDTVSGARRYNALWVDLNRNYPDPEDGPHPDGEEWQAETLHFMESAENNHFVSSANFHGGAEVCNYPWDTWSRLAADDNWWRYVCHEYADTAQFFSTPGYMSGFNDGITNGYAWYSISGGRQDYMTYFHQGREFTLEISNNKLLEHELLPALWDYNYRSLLNYMEQSTFGLRGTVRDSVTGMPIKAEIYVLLHEKDSSWVYTSFPNGNYHRLLFAGNYTVRFSAQGYLTEVRNNVSVANRQATILNVELVPEGVGGIDNNQISKMIRIYPNPLHGDVMYFESDVLVNQIAVYDLAGKEICQLKIDNSSRAINLPDLNNGLYFFRFSTEKGTGIKKIVINR
ncbi:MAG: T9SS type A sorting domain-containing protein [Bacteroidales bacterium]|nr:T9SS type A sorting domain-containing protein [Bacteroidales bacterium]